MEMVSAELGEGAVGVLQRMIEGLDRADDVIDAEVIPQPNAAAEQRLEPEATAASDRPERAPESEPAG
jgi:hypothetical protein